MAFPHPPKVSPLALADALEMAPPPRRVFS
jgi:hypothetical protein